MQAARRGTEHLPLPPRHLLLRFIGGAGAKHVCCACAGQEIWPCREVVFPPTLGVPQCPLACNTAAEQTRSAYAGRGNHFTAGERRRPQGGVAFRETREQLFARFLHSEPEKHRHVRSRYDRPQRLVGAEPNGKAFGRGAPSRINMRAPEITLKPCPGMIAFIRFRRMAAAHPPSVHCGEAQNAGLRRNETHAGPH